MPHKAGFVNIVGLPNVGKSSLINLLLGEKLSIVTSKSQTTRTNVKGFINDDDYQIILVDTPGFIDEPSYQLHLNMNSYVELALEESDLLLFIVDKYNKLEESHPLIQEIKKSKKKVILVLNKIDKCKPEEIIKLYEYYDSVLELEDKICISCEEKIGVNSVVEKILDYMPEHPPYYDKGEWTDTNMRSIASEIIREKILEKYQKEIPYSCEVVIEKYKEKESATIIEAVVYVERNSQKNIIIGHEAKNLKLLSMESRKELEAYIDGKIHLFIFVKVSENWRNKESMLKRFGYRSVNKKKK